MFDIMKTGYVRLNTFTGTPTQAATRRERAKRKQERGKKAER